MTAKKTAAAPSIPSSAIKRPSGGGDKAHFDDEKSRVGSPRIARRMRMEGRPVNRKRLHSKLGYLSSEAFEAKKVA